MIKIKSSVTDFNLQHLIEHKVHDNDTKNRIYDWDEFFRSKLILKLNELFGNDWGLDFTQTPEQGWLIDVFCKDLATAKSIKSIIINSIEGFNIEVFYNNRGI